MPAAANMAEIARECRVVGIPLIDGLLGGHLGGVANFGAGWSWLFDRLVTNGWFVSAGHVGKYTRYWYSRKVHEFSITSVTGRRWYDAV